MAISIQGKRGVQSVTGTSESELRIDKTSALVVAPGRAPYTEQVGLGIVYAAAIPPGTGQAPGTAIATTACMTLANAATSTVNLVLYQIMVGYISGTLGAGVLALLAHTAVGSSITAPSGGTPITPTNMLIGSSGVSVANCRFNNTVPASGVMIRAICGLGASLASTAVQPWAIQDNVGGGVVVGPGQAVSVQGIAAAGSSPLITVALIWAEEPIVA